VLIWFGRGCHEKRKLREGEGVKDIGHRRHLYPPEMFGLPCMKSELTLQPHLYPAVWNPNRFRKSGENIFCTFSATIMSAPMIAWLPIVNQVKKYLATSNYAAQSISLPSVEIHDIETAPEKRPRTLKHLLRANHANYAIIYHNLQYHNHMPHLLGSAYLLGANTDRLQKIYDEEAKELEEWKDSPAEVSDADWRNFLGDKKYQRAYVDFFEDELALKFNYDWKRVADEYLFSGKEPLINGIIAGRKSIYYILPTNYSLPHNIAAFSIEPQC
jgi:hypothetical protein